MSKDFDAIKRAHERCQNGEGDCTDCAHDAGYHDGEDFDRDCAKCLADARQSALDAGIPASVIDGKTKLSDHFSPEYIAAHAGGCKYCGTAIGDCECARGEVERSIE